MRALWFACVMLTACEDASGRGGSPARTMRDFSTLSDAAAADERMAAVYAHSDATLYRIDPDSLSIVEVGPFAWPSLADQMTDIAIDKDGRMIGISFDKVYVVDKTNAKC